jgi:acyl-CoA thioesterase
MKPHRPPPHPFAELISLRFEALSDGASRCSLPVTPALFNPHHVVHGAVLYALADTGMGAALVPGLAEGELCATIEIKISYFKPVTAGVLSCDTTLLNRGKRLANLESRIFCDGVLVAQANGNYSIFTPSSRFTPPAGPAATASTAGAS